MFESVEYSLNMGLCQALNRAITHEEQNLCLVEGDTKMGSRKWRVALLSGIGKSGRSLSRVGIWFTLTLVVRGLEEDPESF